MKKYIIFCLAMQGVCCGDDVKPPKASLMSKVAGLSVGALAGGFGWKSFKGYSLKDSLSSDVILSGLAGGVAGWIVTSMVGSSGKDLYQNYMVAFVANEEIRSHKLFSVPLESLSASVITLYGREDGFEKALTELNNLLATHEKAKKFAEEVLADVKTKSGEWYKGLDGACKTILMQLVEAESILFQRRDLIDAGKERDAFDREFAMASALLKQVATAPLVSCEQGDLFVVMEKIYSKETACETSLTKIAEYQKNLQIVAEKEMVIFSAIEKQDGVWAEALRKGCDELQRKVGTCVEELEIRKKLIVAAQEVAVWEQRYVDAQSRYNSLEEKITDAFMSKRTVGVKESCQQTLDYELSVVDEMRPLSTILTRLRKAVNDMRQAVGDATEQKNMCLRRSEKDERYKNLVESYGKLITRAESEFPFSAFESRIREIYTSKDYEKEIVAQEKEMRHKEVVRSLSAIEKNIEKELLLVRRNTSDVRESIKSTNDKIEKIENDVNRSEGMVSNLNREMHDVEREVRSSKEKVSDFNDKLSVIAANLAMLRQEVAQGAGAAGNNNETKEVRRQIDRLESLLISIVNTLSHVEHNVGALELKITNLEK